MHKQYMYNILQKYMEWDGPLLTVLMKSAAYIVVFQFNLRRQSYIVQSYN